MGVGLASRFLALSTGGGVSREKHPRPVRPTSGPRPSHCILSRAPRPARVCCRLPLGVYGVAGVQHQAARQPHTRTPRLGQFCTRARRRRICAAHPRARILVQSTGSVLATKKQRTSGLQAESPPGKNPLHQCPVRVRSAAISLISIARPCAVRARSTSPFFSHQSRTGSPPSAEDVRTRTGRGPHVGRMTHLKETDADRTRTRCGLCRFTLGNGALARAWRGCGASCRPQYGMSGAGVARVCPIPSEPPAPYYCDTSIWADQLDMSGAGVARACPGTEAQDGDEDEDDDSDWVQWDEAEWERPFHVLPPPFPPTYCSSAGVEQPRSARGAVLLVSIRGARGKHLGCVVSTVHCSCGAAPRASSGPAPPAESFGMHMTGLWEKLQRPRTGRGPDAGCAIEFEETDADRMWTGREVWHCHLSRGAEPRRGVALPAADVGAHVRAMQGSAQKRMAAADAVVETDARGEKRLDGNAPHRILRIRQQKGTDRDRASTLGFSSETWCCTVGTGDANTREGPNGYVWNSRPLRPLQSMWHWRGEQRFRYRETPHFKDCRGHVGVAHAGSGQSAARNCGRQRVLQHHVQHGVSQKQTLAAHSPRLSLCTIVFCHVRGGGWTESCRPLGGCPEPDSQSDSDDSDPDLAETSQSDSDPS
eukprot:gene6698-biopygen11938